MHDATRTPEQALAGALLFDTLSAGFRYPDAELYATIADGRFSQTLAMALGELAEADSWLSLLDDLTAGIATLLDQGHARLQSDYIALFDTDRSTTPVRLYAHLYSDSQESQLILLQRLQATYHAQGIVITSGRHAEQADHLCVQLDFFALLQHRLHQALSASPPAADTLAIAAAIAGFRQELSWIPRLAEQFMARCSHPFYTPLCHLLVFAILVSAQHL